MSGIELPIPRAKLAKRTFGEKLLGLDDPENAYARAKNIVLSGHFSRFEVAHVAADYRGDLCKDFHDRWLDLLEEIVYYLLEDGKLDPGEQEFVREYLLAFAIDGETAKGRYQRAARRVFVERLRDEIGDGLGGQPNPRELLEFARRLKLADVKSPYEEVVEEVLCQFLEMMLEDELLSPDEWKRYQLLCDHFAVKPRVGSFLEIESDRCRLRWSLLNDPLPVVATPDLRLGKDERAFFVGGCAWYETRAVRLGGGVTESQYKLIHEGEIVLTNLRLLLLADRGSNKSLKWSGLLGVEAVGRDQIECTKERGKSPVIRFRTEPIGGALIATRLFDEAS